LLRRNPEEAPADGKAQGQRCWETLGVPATGCVSARRESIAKEKHRLQSGDSTSEEIGESATRRYELFFRVRMTNPTAASIVARRVGERGSGTAADPKNSAAKVFVTSPSLIAQVEFCTPENVLPEMSPYHTPSVEEEPRVGADGLVMTPAQVPDEVHVEPTPLLLEVTINVTVSGTKRSKLNVAGLPE
jgi:hypothetical protein